MGEITTGGDVGAIVGDTVGEGATVMTSNGLVGVAGTFGPEEVQLVRKPNITKTLPAIAQRNKVICLVEHIL